MTAEEVVAELWSRGDTDFLLHPGQLKIERAFNESKHKVFGAECARQIGKTFWGVKKADQIARKYPGASLRIGTAFYTDLDAIIIPAFERVLRTCPDPLKPRHKTIGGKFVYPNGSDIRLVGLDRNPDKLRGSRLRYVGLEEAGFGDPDALRYAHDSVIVPAFTHEPEARCTLISTPPETGADHTFCELVDEAALHNAYIKLTIYDNPMLTPERIADICKSLGGEDSVAWKREALCQRIVEVERAITPEWKQEYEVEFEPEEADPLYKFWHKYEGLDIGVQVDKTLNIYGYYNFKESCLYIMHETDISGVKTTTDLIYSTIIEKEKDIGYESPYRRISDNSHPLLLNDLSSKGLVFAPTDKAKIHEMVGELRVWIRAGRIKVHKRCKQMLGCLRTGIWNRQRTEFERSRVYGHYDALAALIYLVRNTDQWTNPLPDYLSDPDGWNRWKKKEVPLSPLGKGMRDLFSNLK